MCYLPRRTFYLYFGFFFAGYVWIFGILFLNLWSDSNKVSPKDFGGDSLTSLLELSSELAVLSDEQKESCRLYNKLTLCYPQSNANDGVEDSSLQKSLLTSLHNVAHAGFFMDIGASNGYESLLMSSVGHNAMLFEPRASHSRFLLASALANGLQHKITVLQAAPGMKTCVDKQCPNDAKTVQLDDLLMRSLKFDALVQTSTVVMKYEAVPNQCDAILGATQLLLKTKFVYVKWHEVESNNVCKNATMLISKHFKPLNLLFEPIEFIKLSPPNNEKYVVWINNNKDV